MRKADWLLATAILAVGFGFGHAGCYTSGTPGGLGAGGASTSDASTSAGGLDASTNALGGSSSCRGNSDCASPNHVCTQDGGQCVECVVNQDCVADAGAGGAGGSGASSNSYCFQNTCNTYKTCGNSLQCTGFADAGVCDSNSHCVQCVNDPDCASLGVLIKCSGYLCSLPCNSDTLCTPIGLLCNVDAGVCTAPCAVNSDCHPGNICGADHKCAPSNSVP